jgi:serine/threonine protein kinase
VKEQAFMEVFNDEVSVPRIFPMIKTADITNGCFGNSMVSQFAGYYTLDCLAIPVDTRLLSGIMKAIIKRIKKIHENGFIHGDIHRRNVVFSDVNNIPGTLYLIDFGRTAPYVLDSGEHLGDQSLSSSEVIKWSPNHLSRFELELSRKSRRDDMFRIAELLIYLGDYDNTRLPSEPICPSWFRDLDRLRYQNRKSLCDEHYKKTKRTLKPDTPRLYANFYEECDELGYYATPRYDFWITEFAKFP